MKSLEKRPCYATRATNSYQKPALSCLQRTYVRRSLTPARKDFRHAIIARCHERPCRRSRTAHHNGLSTPKTWCGHASATRPGSRRRATRRRGRHPAVGLHAIQHAKTDRCCQNNLGRMAGNAATTSPTPSLLYVRNAGHRRAQVSGPRKEKDKAIRQHNRPCPLVARVSKTPRFGTTRPQTRFWLHPAAHQTTIKK